MKVLITGASSGIGEACARILAKKGHSLILIARRFERLQKLKKELEANHPGVEVLPVELDVSQRNAVEDWFQKHRDAVSDLDVLINNAGLALGVEPIQEARVDDWETMIDVNLKGLLYITRQVLPHFVKNKKGHVVNIGSVAGHHVYAGGNVYSATKFGVRALTDSMRIDLHGTGIRVSEISPGRTETEFSIVRLGDEQKANAVYEGMTPLTGADIAEAIAWVIDRPAHVNIQEIILYPTDQSNITLVKQDKKRNS